jgi:nucleoside-triphosphatase THEP1
MRSSKDAQGMRGQIAILTGDRGSGKSTACRELAQQVRQRGLDCAGLVCPARFDDARKVGIDLINLRTGESRPLAEADDQPSALRTRAYRFDPAVMEWGKACLDAACPCDVLIIDELGPLELERRQGWVNAIEILRAGEFGFAVTVIRPSLIDTFVATVSTTQMWRFALPDSLLGEQANTARAEVLGQLLSLLRSLSSS